MFLNMILNLIAMTAMCLFLHVNPCEINITDYEAIYYYARPITELNVREGPGTEYGILRTINNNNVITTFFRKDEWTYIKVNQDYGWVNSDYLTECEEEELKENKIKVYSQDEIIEDETYDTEIVDTNQNITITDGDEFTLSGYNYDKNFGEIGRFIIPDTGVDVAVYVISFDNDYGYSQGVVDRQDSAGMYLDTPTQIIADHKNQGFEGIKNCVYGTRAYLLHGDGTYYEYMCTGVDPNCINDEYHLYTSGGVDILSTNVGAMVAYTCNENWQHITMTYFTPI